MRPAHNPATAMSQGTATEAWPSLPLDAWKETYATLHMWMQIVGKIRLVQNAWVNHSWHVTLYVTSRGLTTGPVPYGNRTFNIDFDFVDHVLIVQSSDGRSGRVPLHPQSVAKFYASLKHFRTFRAPFSGKCSPIHFFWGAADLAVTRFSGRRAPKHPGGIPHLPDWVTQEAYCEEVSSCGFWPGGGPIPYAAFYSYAYPEPANFAAASVQPAEAFYSNDMHEFILPYEIVRQSQSPDDTLLQFLQTTYAAAANLAKWDRASLERGGGPKSAIPAAPDALR